MMRRKIPMTMLGGVLFAFFGTNSLAQGTATPSDNLPKCKIAGDITESWAGEVYLFGDDMAWITGYYGDVDITLENITLDPSFKPKLKLSFRIDADGSVGNTQGELQLGTANGLSAGFITDWRYTYSYADQEETFDPINLNFPSVCGSVCSKLGSGPESVTRETMRTQIAVAFEGHAFNLNAPNERVSATADLSDWPRVHDQMMSAYDQLTTARDAGQCDDSL